MVSAAKLKEALLEAGSVPADRLADAEHFAEKESVPLEDALISLKAIAPEQLGQQMAKATGLPYVSLAEPPADQIKQLLPTACAAFWKAVPTGYDDDAQALKVAIADPDRGRTLEQVFAFFMQPMTFSFSIASSAEITQALSGHYGVAAAAAGGAGQKRVLSGLHKPRKKEAPHSEKPAPQATLRMPRSRPAAASTTHVSAVTVPEYEDMNRALLNAVSTIVRSQLKDDPDRLEDAQSCLRYCQLIATRLSLQPKEADGLVLAAWLCTLENSKDLAMQVGGPHKLEEILFPGDTLEDKERVESRILSLVRCYREMVANDPSGSRDVGVTRRSLRSAWSSSPTQQNLLELFLQILMDEQFLENLGQASGTILLVGPTEATTPTLGPALAADGYDILVARGGSDVAEILGDRTPDLIIAEFEQEVEDGVKLCQQLRKDDATKDVSLLVVMEEANTKRAAECLRAGADDFLTNPVNLELLFIRMERLMQTSPDQVTEDAGVKGSLGDMNFTDMIQILSAGGKDVEIRLKRDDLEGEVYVKGGAVVHAALGAILGEAAFFKLMRWTDGEFTTKQCTEPPEASITANTMSLLMEGARQADEGEDVHAADGLITVG